MTNANSHPLYDHDLIAARHARRTPEKHFLFCESAKLLRDRLSVIRQTFKAIEIDGIIAEPLQDLDQKKAATSVKKADLILSHMSLHWSEDLSQSLQDIYARLAEGGLFLGVCFGLQTLGELRLSLNEAELAQRGGISPRFSPLPDLNEAGRALESTGFVHTVVDREMIRVRFPTFTALLHTIREMGETNALHERRKSIEKRALFRKAEKNYISHFMRKEGDLEATFELLFFHGWKED